MGMGCIKQKILFYGNCHTWALGKYFLSDSELQKKFEVIGVDDSCAPMVLCKEHFSVMKLSGFPSDYSTQRQYCTAVHEKIKQADFFVFQNTKLSSCIPELTTKFLCDNIVTGKAICVPNPRLTIHCFELSESNPYIKYAQTKVSDPYNVEEIVEFLCTSDDPTLTEILEQEYPISTVYIQGRNENHQRAKLCMEQYPAYICMESFLKENFKSKVMAFDPMHPTKVYFVELVRLLLTNIGVDKFTINKKNHIARYWRAPWTAPGAQHAKINPMQFKFFKEYFPLLNEEFQANSAPVSRCSTFSKIRNMTTFAK